MDNNTANSNPVNTQEIKPIGSNPKKNYLKISLPLAGMVLLAGAAYLTVNNALQQQTDNRSRASVAANMVANPGFESGTSTWQFNRRSGSAAYTTSTINKQSGALAAQVSVTSKSSDPWEIELAQYGKSITAGQTYTVSFWAKASVTRPIDVVLQDGSGSYTVFMRKTPSISTNWQQYTYTFTASQSRSTAFVGFQFADAVGTVWIDDVAFYSGNPVVPTQVPTATKAPTAVPTQVPTATSAPTQVPTATKVPTQVPTATTVPTATPTPVQTPIMTINKSSYTAGENITVYWNNVPNATATDWIGLYRPTSVSGDEIGWIYVNCTQTATVAVATGSCTFPLPTTAPAGALELRYHPNDTNNVVVKSPTFTLVGPTATPTPSPVLITATPFPTTVPTVSPTVIAQTPMPTATVVPGNTYVSVALLLHGLGKGGDAVNAGSTGNMNPLHPQRAVTVDIYDVQNQLVVSKPGTVTFNPTLGNFAGNVELGAQFATGIYTVKVKTEQHLRGLVGGIQTITQGQTTNLPSATLVTGDINNDNAINIVDYNIIVGCYSDLLPPVSCNDINKVRADMTDDGNVNQFDYNLFIRELTNLGGQ